VLRDAAQHDPTNPTPFARLGSYYFVCGHKQKGFKFCERALALEPSNVNLQLQLANAHMAMGTDDSLDAAIAIYERVRAYNTIEYESMNGFTFWHNLVTAIN
jgi:cytochrome c-type biogenesis protein CcmH/NrfG